MDLENSQHREVRQLLRLLESPGYTVPEESGFTWMPGFVPVSEVVLEGEGGYMRSLEEPLPPQVPTPAVTTAIAPVVAEPMLPMVPPTPDDKTTVSDTESVRKWNGHKCS